MPATYVIQFTTKDKFPREDSWVDNVMSDNVFIETYTTHCREILKRRIDTAYFYTQGRSNSLPFSIRIISRKVNSALSSDAIKNFFLQSFRIFYGEEAKWMHKAITVTKENSSLTIELPKARYPLSFLRGLGCDVSALFYVISNRFLTVTDELLIKSTDMGKAKALFSVLDNAVVEDNASLHFLTLYHIYYYSFPVTESVNGPASNMRYNILQGYTDESSNLAMMKALPRTFKKIKNEDPEIYFHVKFNSLQLKQIIEFLEKRKESTYA